MTQFRVCIVDDHPTAALRQLIERLTGGAARVTEVSRPTGFTEDCRRAEIVVLDMNLPPSDGISGGAKCLRALAETSGGSRNICIFTGYADAHAAQWRECFELFNGALKDRVAVFAKAPNVAGDPALLDHIETVWQAFSRGIRYDAATVIRIAMLAAQDEPVLVLGEAGVGKEETARQLHRLWAKAHPAGSVVAGKPLVFNCGGLSAELIRSELMGAVSGAFTGASTHTMGAILRAAGFQEPAPPTRALGYVPWLRTTNPTRLSSTADVRVSALSPRRASGTLFLDEVGDLTPAAQVVLLRFLGTWEVQPVGYPGVIRPEGAEPLAPLVRVISATNRPGWIARAGKGNAAQGDELPRVDVYNRFAPRVVYIQPLTTDEVEPLVQQLAPDVDWSIGLPILKQWVKDRELSGNRRELRSILRNARDMARAWRYGFPLPRKNVVTEEILETFRPGKVLNLQGAVSADVGSAATAVWGTGHAGSRLIAIDERSSVEALAKALRNEFDLRAEKGRVAQWTTCAPTLFDEETARRFRDGNDSSDLWKLACLRMFLELGDKQIAGAFKDEGRRDWKWPMIGELTTPTVREYLEERKKAAESSKAGQGKRAGAQPVLAAVDKILRDLKDESEPGSGPAAEVRRLARRLYGVDQPGA